MMSESVVSIGADVHVAQQDFAGVVRCCVSVATMGRCWWEQLRLPLVVVRYYGVFI